MYMQLNDAEAAFRTLKQDLSIRPIYHQLEDRVKAHVLVCFLAYAMYRTLDGLGVEHGVVAVTKADAVSGERDPSSIPPTGSRSVPPVRAVRAISAARA